MPSAALQKLLPLPPLLLLLLLLLPLLLLLAAAHVSACRRGIDWSRS
jgi:hypothetical protein